MPETEMTSKAKALAAVKRNEALERLKRERDELAKAVAELREQLRKETTYWSVYWLLLSKDSSGATVYFKRKTGSSYIFSLDRADACKFDKLGDVWLMIQRVPESMAKHAVVESCRMLLEFPVERLYVTKDGFASKEGEQKPTGLEAPAPARPIPDQPTPMRERPTPPRPQRRGEPSPVATPYSQASSDEEDEGDTLAIPPTTTTRIVAETGTTETPRSGYSWARQSSNAHVEVDFAEYERAVARAAQRITNDGTIRLTNTGVASATNTSRSGAARSYALEE